MQTPVSKTSKPSLQRLYLLAQRCPRFAANLSVSMFYCAYKGKPVAIDINYHSRFSWVTITMKTPDIEYSLSRKEELAMRDL
jgi:hypothetical protein